MREPTFLDALRIVRRHATTLSREQHRSAITAVAVGTLPAEGDLPERRVMVSTDGRTLCLVRLPQDAPPLPDGCLLPPWIVDAMLAGGVCVPFPDWRDWEVDGQHVIGETAVYPNWRKIIPNGADLTAEIPVSIPDPRPVFPPALRAKFGSVMAEDNRSRLPTTGWQWKPWSSRYQPPIAFCTPAGMLPTFRGLWVEPTPDGAIMQAVYPEIPQGALLLDAAALRKCLRGRRGLLRFNRADPKYSPVLLSVGEVRYLLLPMLHYNKLDNKLEPRVVRMWTPQDQWMAPH